MIIRGEIRTSLSCRLLSVSCDRSDVTYRTGHRYRVPTVYIASQPRASIRVFIKIVARGAKGYVPGVLGCKGLRLFVLEIYEYDEDAFFAGGVG